MSISPELLHQILLSPRIDDVPIPRISTISTPGFQTYQKQLLETNQVDPSMVMKRAFHDHMLQSVITSTEQQLTPLQQLLLELHQKLRDLVPNRKDLHEILKDDRPNLTLFDTAIFLGWVMEAGKALSMLESEAESITTTSWIELTRNMSSCSNFSSLQPTKQISFLICSLLYLMDKADRAQQEKQSFYLRTAILPRLFHTEEGYQLERKYMMERFPNFDWPMARKWIRSLLSNISTHDMKEICDNPQRRKEMIARGWIESIVFQKDHEVYLPEMFCLDLDTLRAIRSVTRLAAAGCALGLHATQMAKKPPDVIVQQESKGDALIQVLNSQAFSSDSPHGSYETKVEDTMIGLVKEWRGEEGSTLSETEIETLRQQTRNVLRSQDPVIKLLDKRMQTVFGDLAVVYVQQSGQSTYIGVEMHTGINGRATNQSVETVFAVKARQAFASQGLGLYACDLVKAAELASRVPALASQLYDKQILDLILTEGVDSQDTTTHM
ncbi:hypothetical protein IV203_036700 [Nitzschia inconspicua]|uniref:Uncharacterized protein n=1 Tax=Nitzschia inconspicua TaxID=303405 RepID=A0A9K3LH56_9STRA|nr:hypothetical protein IV203_036700 [Nitzschia inconspicua]